MASSIQCPHCGQTYPLTAEQEPQYAGQTIQCTKCGKMFTVPGSSSAPGTSMPAAPMNYASPMRVTTSGMAIASLVLACIGLFVPLLGIVAIVLGIIALRKMSDPSIGGKGLAIAGISVGSVSLLLSICMLSILLPSL